MLKLNEFLYIEKKMFEYCDLIQQILWRENGHSTLFPFSSKNLRYDPHHHGYINNLLRISCNNRTKQNDYLEKLKIFFEDDEHGFEHGFFCGFLDYLINDFDFKKIYRLKSYHKRTLSLFLHDFAKTEFNHDEKCRDYFSCLEEAVYDHASPKEINFLVKVDRIELMRYEDFDDWLDFNKLPKNKINVLKYFYKKFFKIYKKPLLVHAIENPIFIKNKIEKYPPPYSNNYLIESPLPHQDFAPPVIDWFKTRGHSAYDGFFLDICDKIWMKKLAGFIDVENKKINFKNSNVDRDHVCFDDYVDIEEWIFISSRDPKFKYLPKEESVFLNHNLFFLNVSILKKIINIKNHFFSRLLFFNN